MPIGLRTRVPGAVTIEVEFVGGRAVVLATVDGSERKGALTSVAAEQLAAAAHAARERRIPLVASIASSGADIVEGMSALHGWGVAAQALASCSGIVPTVMIVAGPAVSGPALLLGLADHVIFTEDSYAFVSGPTMVAEFTGEQLDNAKLGGSATHARASGVATAVVRTPAEALDLVEYLLSFYPDSTNELPPVVPTDDPAHRLTPEAGDLLPILSTGSYDVRDIVRVLADDGEFFELRAGWAPNMVTGLARIGGRSVGVVANQPVAIAGTLDIPASQKAARFVATCDAFNQPILTLVDTPGFYPGKDLEWRGMIRHGAQLVYAYATASVPRICLILRKSYGGAYIVMDSKRMGNDLCLAWPGAELAVMGAGQAAAILQRRASPEARAAFEADYSERLLNPYIAADRGLVDAVIEPADSRSIIADALMLLESKRELLGARKHGNTPL